MNCRTSVKYKIGTAIQISTFSITGFPIIGAHLGLDAHLTPPHLGGGGGTFNNNSTAAANHDPNVKVTLENEDLWRRFHEIGTEMIITKMGR